ncbi:MAG: glucose 1-dehydrogenase [Candidatus Tectomicrobia bacterium]|uniref:Glucose 1-dehydrogenase n=1 Tax=Tectimicrobiota bacterium TaxID=2528274 RepID=A0A932GR12_UNCTE|nr:glucose 1-dehydrogenase [Candidatus Tectomicrobia bacterium]
MRLQGRVAIVTGGGHGIGRAYCLGLAREGATVAAADIDGEAARETQREIEKLGGKGLGLETDVASVESTQMMAQRTQETFGSIDILVNNAAVFSTIPISRVPFDQVPLDEWDRVMTVNLKGLLLSCRAVVPVMRRQKKGKIINISSASIYKGTGNRIHYVTSKAGVIGFTRTLAHELGDDGICVNAVAPGSTLSESPKDTSAVAFRQSAVSDRCLKRIETPQDLVGAILFLSSDDSDFITGQTIVVDGGSSLI